MRKETIKLIEEYFRNYPEYGLQRALLKKIFLQTTNTEKGEIIKYCELEVKRLQFHFFVRSTIIFLVITFCLNLLDIFTFDLIIIFHILLILLGLYGSARTEITYVIMPSIVINFLLGDKKNFYDNLFMLKEFLSLDNYYDPFGCLGCVNFCGETYNGNPLVCAIHPYGQENCPDFEQPGI